MPTFQNEQGWTGQADRNSYYRLITEVTPTYSPLLFIARCVMRGGSEEDDSEVDGGIFLIDYL